MRFWANLDRFRWDEGPLVRVKIVNWVHTSTVLRAESVASRDRYTKWGPRMARSIHIRVDWMCQLRFRLPRFTVIKSCPLIV